MMKCLLLTALMTIAVVAHANEPAPTPYQGDPAKGEAIAAGICAACHTPDGNSVTPTYPKLASQNAGYLYKQMQNFSMPMVNGQPVIVNGQPQPPERINPIMNGMIAAFNDEQKRDLAAWFASQTEKHDDAATAADTSLGQKIFRLGNPAKGLPACTGCHGPTGAGIPAQYPRIAGQFSDYIELQLKSFQNESRANDPNKMMRTVALMMTDAEIKAVAEYLAGLR